MSLRSIVCLVSCLVAGCVTELELEEETSDLDLRLVMPEVQIWSGHDWVQDVDVVGSYVYWSADTGIYRRAVSGGSTQTLCRPCNGTSKVTGISVSGDYVYFTSPYNAAFRMFRLRVGTGTVSAVGSNLLIGGNGTFTSNGIRELVQDTGYLYWHADKRIYRITKASAAVEVIHTDTGSIRDLVQDDTYLYFTTSGRRLGRLRKSNQAVTTLYTADYPLHSLAIVGSELFFSDSWEYLYRAPVWGGSATRIGAQRALPLYYDTRSLAVSADKQWVYVSGEGYVGAMNTQTEKVTWLYDSTVSASEQDLNVIGDDVFWRDQHAVYRGTMYGTAVSY